MFLKFFKKILFGSGIERPDCHIVDQHVVGGFQHKDHSFSQVFRLQHVGVFFNSRAFKKISFNGSGIDQTYFDIIPSQFLKK